MSKVAVETHLAPPPRIGIYSQAIVAAGLVFCSGSLPADTTGAIIEGDIKIRTHQCIKNLGKILEAAGSSLEKVVKVNIFLTNKDDFNQMNEVYKLYWGDIKPARTCVIVKELPRESQVEIECTATL